MKKWILLLLLLFSILFNGKNVFCAAPTRQEVYTSGEIISSSDVTSNEDVIFNYLQSGVDTIKDNTIVNADINTSANIQSGKLNLTAISQNIVNTGTLTNTGDVTIIGNLGVGSTVPSSQKEVRWYEGTNYVGFEAPTLTANQIWILPKTDGTASQRLQTDGSGTLTWSASGGAPEGTAVLSTGEGGAVKFLREDGDGTSSWQVPAGSGDVSKVGTPVNDQVGVWTGDGTLEGDGDLTFNGTILTAVGFSGPLTGAVTGNASTSTALAANPDDCSANQFAQSIIASGNLTCSAIGDADVPNDITIDLSTAATALAANGGNCSAGSYPLGVDASGAVESCTDASTEVDSIVATHMAIIADTSTIGHLNDTDWDTFNNKVSENTAYQICFIIDGGGSAITTGEKAWVRATNSFTIGSVEMTSDTSTTTVVDLWKDTYANFPPTNADTITASAVPTITTAIKSQDNTITGWTTSVTAGDYILPNVSSNDNSTFLEVCIYE